MSWFKGLKYLVAAASALAPLALVVPVFAMSGGCGGECASCHSITLQEAGSLLKGIGVVKDVRPAEVRGLYEVTFDRQGNSGVAYVDYGKKYIIAGQAFDIASRQPVGANAPAAKQQERLDPKTLSSNDALVMGNPAGKKKLFVFTDPECPYCAKAHAELKKLAALEPDLAIYIKLFPLRMHPNAYDKSRVILAAKSLELLENSFAGKALPAATEATPKKPVDETIRFAAAAGINSTPTLVLPDGRVLPGFKDAAALRKLLTGTN